MAIQEFYLWKDEAGQEHALSVSTTNGQLFVDSEPVMTVKRFSNYERTLAGLGLAVASIGVAATVVQAWYAAFPPMTP